MIPEIVVGLLVGTIPLAAVAFWQLVLRGQRLPKRISRVENGMVIQLRVQGVVFDALLVIARCVDHEQNGELEEMKEAVHRAKTDMSEYLSAASISQKRPP